LQATWQATWKDGHDPMERTGSCLNEWHEG
jgi:hypothetical protein